MEIKVYEGTKEHHIPFTEGTTLLTLLRRAGFRNIPSTCGGKGTCRKCRVHVQTADRSGICLACFTLARDGMIVTLEDPASAGQHL
ncbi:MAG: 2Fe-2S iron-sulfur cluster-binding protein [Eubacteriales bacterium]|nr:2Fe-2S iron-sulfur cluster-binding protein [Eubacteriales bacterium]